MWMFINSVIHGAVPGMVTPPIRTCPKLRVEQETDTITAQESIGVEGKKNYLNMLARCITLRGSHLVNQKYVRKLRGSRINAYPFPPRTQLFNVTISLLCSDMKIRRQISTRIHHCHPDHPDLQWFRTVPAPTITNTKKGIKPSAS